MRVQTGWRREGAAAPLPLREARSASLSVDPGKDPAGLRAQYASQRAASYYYWPAIVRLSTISLDDAPTSRRTMPPAAHGLLSFIRGIHGAAARDANNRILASRAVLVIYPSCARFAARQWNTLVRDDRRYSYKVSTGRVGHCKSVLRVLRKNNYLPTCLPARLP